MLSALFGKKSHHPLADIKSVQALLDDLPKNDALKTVMELSEWLESAAISSEFKLDHQFAVVRMLDEAVQPYARKLVREYFIAQELHKFQENRLWMVLGNLSRHATHAYFSVFSRYCNGDKGGSAIKAQLPLLVARTVNAMSGRLKYVCAHYGPFEDTLWIELAQLYTHAEQQQYLDTPLILYSTGAGTTSVKCEMAHLLGWYGCGVGNLTPLYMHLTERIVAHYCSAVNINSRLGESDLFCFDLIQPAAPTRIKVDASTYLSSRFINMADLRPKLEVLIKALEKNFVPEELNLGGVYDAELVRGAAQYLLDYVNAPPLRRSVRRIVKVGLNVASGFANVVEHTDAGLNFSEEPPLRWEVEDISADGFRTVLPLRGSDAIRIGSLLGIQPEGVAHWGVAIVRRLRRDNANQLHAGVEMLANRIAGVALIPSGGGVRGGENEQPALWLYGKSGEQTGEVRLLMKADTFSNNRSWQTRLEGKNYLLIPGGLQEKSLDYELALFRVVEQDSSSDEF